MVLVRLSDGIIVEVNDAYLAIFGYESSGTGEFRVLRSDGVTQWIAITGRRDPDGTERPIRAVGVFMDALPSPSA